MSTSRPHINVLIPAYNEAPGIGRSLDSCLAAVEVIGDGYSTDITVLANGCQDNTAEVADAWGGRTITDVHNIGFNVVDIAIGHKNQALNYGLANTVGDYTFTMDADVTIDSDALPVLLRVLATGAPKAASLYHTADPEFTPSGTLGNIVQMADLRRQAIPRRYKLHGGFMGWNAAVADEGLRFPEDKPVGDDTWLSFDLINRHGPDSIHSVNSGQFTYYIPPQTLEDFVKLNSRYEISNDLVARYCPELVSAIALVGSLQPPIDAINERWRQLCDERGIDFDDNLPAYQAMRTKISENTAAAMGEVIANNGRWTPVMSTRITT